MSVLVHECYRVTYVDTGFPHTCSVFLCKFLFIADAKSRFSTITMEEDDEENIEKVNEIIIPPNLDKMTGELNSHDGVIGEATVQGVPDSLEVHIQSPPNSISATESV